MVVRTTSAGLVLLLAAGACGSGTAAGRKPVIPSPGAVEEGLATYYSSRLAGRKTASGEPYDPAQFTAAHRVWACGTLVRVSRLDAPKARPVIVRLNDRGPFSGKRIIDLSMAAAKSLGMVSAGVVRVRIEALGRESDAARAARR
jgi:rare lipoprotein A